jgi:hypothetical protein
MKKKDSILDDDLDDLINDISNTKAGSGYAIGGAGTGGTKLSQPAFKYEVPAFQGGSSKTSSVIGSGGKCYPLYIGGSTLGEGMTQSSLNPRSCDKLRCSKCDKKVHRFAENKWKLSVDYLFVRNHNTNLKELVKVS